MKMTRKQIKEGLDQVPIEAVLIGVNNPAGVSLSPKDREFARQLALGESKAAAYRKSRPTRAKPESQSRRGQDLAKKSAIVSQVEAFKVAIEAEKSRTPAQLRALVIHRLTEKAIDPAVPEAQQIKALELLGKITEVALFTERREIVKVTDAGEMRARFMQALNAAMKAGAVDAQITEGESLLAEIADARVIESDDTAAPDAGAGPETPPGATPLNAATDALAIGHSNPHTQSPPQAESPVQATPDENVTIAPLK